MSAEAFRLLIHSQPVWHGKVANLPVTVQTVYTVLGRQNNRWSTILAKATDIDDARDVMIRATDSGQYDRVVIAKANSVNRAPATNWQTIECALPRAIVPASDFQKLVEKMQHDTANKPRDFYLVGSLQSCNVILFLATLLAAASLNAAALFTVSFFAMCEAILMADTRPLTMRKAKLINGIRNWTYALFVGALLWPLTNQLLFSY